MSDTKETEGYTTVELTLDNDEVIECAILKKFTGCRLKMQWTQSNLFEEGFIAMLPTDLYNGADIPFNAIAGSIIMTCNVWIKILTDEKEVIFIRQTKACPIN